MFHRVFTPLCLCSTTDRRVFCSFVSLLHRVYVPPLTGGFYVPSCLQSSVSMFHQSSPNPLWLTGLKAPTN